MTEIAHHGVPVPTGSGASRGVELAAPIHVLHVATSYPRDACDWRGRFIADISAALARRDDLRIAQWAPPGEVDPRVEIATTKAEERWLEDLMAQGGISHRMRTRPLAGMAGASTLLRMLWSAYRRRGDIQLYHVNWLQCALPLPDDGCPALITVLGNDMQLLRLPLMKQALRRVMRGRPVALCPNAGWMEAPLRDMFGDLAIVRSIPFGIDPRWYAIRRDAGTLASPPRWLAVTRLTADKLGPLFEWSAPLFSGTSRQLHLFGPMQEQVAVPDWLCYHGPATPDQLARDWFPLAQGLVTLSRHAEGRPQVMLEAMAAGLPIVASRLPAHSDLMADGETGVLCDSAGAYADAVASLENPAMNLRIGQAATAWVKQALGTWDDCAARYVNLYRELLGRVAHA